MISDRLRGRLRRMLPHVAFVGVLACVLWLRPNAASYFGFNLLFNLAAPLAFAGLSQMFVIAASDIDLSTGPFVGLVTAVAATMLVEYPLLATGALAILISAYIGAGILIHVRQLPSIVVTLGLAFIWQGCAVILLPSPGGSVPAWLSEVMAIKTWLFPLSIWLMIGGSLIAWSVLYAWSFGAVLRGIGGNSRAVANAGWSVLVGKAVLYGLAGLFGVIAGLMLAGLVRSGDPLIAREYTLLSIAAVILGGGEFVGGKVSPFGAVTGAATLVLASTLLSFLNLPSDFQLGSQGIVLLLVLSGRALLMVRTKS